MAYVLTDLVTLTATQSALSRMNLNAAEQAYLPSAITNASNLVRNWCGGVNFTRNTYDDVLPVTPSYFVFPRQYPLNGVSRIMTSRTTLLTIAQLNVPTVQWATVGWATTGDYATGLTATGIVLTASSYGVATPQTVLFSSLSPPTLASLATAVNALGTGWQALVTGPATNGAWGVAELVTSDVAAQDGLEGAQLQAFTQVVLGGRIVPDGQYIDLSASNVGVGNISQFAWSSGSLIAPGGDRIVLPPVRMIYDSGFDVIPTPVQQGTIEAVKLLMERLRTDMSKKAASLGDYSWQGVGPELLDAIPLAVRRGLEFYRRHWIF